MQVPNGTGPGVRRSKRPLLASRTRCNVLWKPPKFGNKVKIGIKVQFGNTFANRCNVWSIEIVIVYGHVPECHVTFGRGRLHNVWWDPQEDFGHRDVYNCQWCMRIWSFQHFKSNHCKIYWSTYIENTLYPCVIVLSQCKNWTENSVKVRRRCK